MPNDRVILRIVQDGSLSFARARLIFEGSQPYAIADDDEGFLPENVKIPLDPSLLEEQHDDGLEFRLFLYRANLALPR